MKGCHSFLKLDFEKLCNATQLIDTLLDTNHVKVVLLGAFTKKTKKKDSYKTRNQLAKGHKSIKWLNINNHFYSTLRFPEIDTLVPPKIEIHDEDNEVDAENENVELNEDFKVAFPEAGIHEQNSGKLPLNLLFNLCKN